MEPGFALGLYLCICPSCSLSSPSPSSLPRHLALRSPRSSKKLFNLAVPTKRSESGTTSGATVREHPRVVTIYTITSTGHERLTSSVRRIAE